MIFSWNCSVMNTQTKRFRFSWLLTTLRLCFLSENFTFCDLSVVCESSAQRDGDRWKVSHVVAVAVHSTVPAWAERLRGQTGGMEARIWEAPNRWPGITAGHTRWWDWPEHVQKLQLHRGPQHHKPLGKIKSCHFRLQFCDVIQINAIRSKMAASFVCNRERFYYENGAAKGILCRIVIVMLPFLLVGESVLPGGRVTVSSMSPVLRASATSALTVSVSILAESDSIPTAMAVSSVASWLNNSLSSGISEHALRPSEEISGVITRKCVLSDTGMDSGHTGGGSDLNLRKDGWKRRKEKH